MSESIYQSSPNFRRHAVTSSCQSLYCALYPSFIQLLKEGSRKIQIESWSYLLTDFSILLSIERHHRHRIHCSTSSEFRSWLNQHSAPSSLASWRWLLLFLEVVQLWRIQTMRTLLRLWLLMVCTASHKFVEAVIYVALYDDDDDGNWAWR